jgi:hypothetical protein
MTVYTNGLKETETGEFSIDALLFVRAMGMVCTRHKLETNV